jgi:hypothetical protein
MVEEFLSAGRVKTLQRLLWLALAFGVVVALLALPGIVGDFEKYVVTLLLIGAVLGGVSGAALRAVRQRHDSAKRLCIATGVLLIIASLPLMAILIGLLTAVLGVGILMVTVAPEREAP